MVVVGCRRRGDRGASITASESEPFFEYSSQTAMSSRMTTHRSLICEIRVTREATVGAIQKA